MGNDNYEMYGKLSAQLGKLVIDGKRHLPTVNARLRTLVFDAHHWPKAKNWSAVHELAKSDQLMASVIATLDMYRTDNRAKQIIAAFPDCFLDAEKRDIIPLSCIRAMAIVAAHECDDQRDTEIIAAIPASYCVHEELKIPFSRFYTSVDSDWNEEEPMLPAAINPLAKQGEVVLLEGIEHVVLENNQNTGVHLMTLVLREHVDPTC
ncbi:MAG: hypothetical protein ABIT47_01170 [Candidatus Paceibacterota bacterium]